MTPQIPEYIKYLCIQMQYARALAEAHKDNTKEAPDTIHAREYTDKIWEVYNLLVDRNNDTTEF